LSVKPFVGPDAAISGRGEGGARAPVTDLQKVVGNNEFVFFRRQKLVQKDKIFPRKINASLDGQ
jgi:hypothetical protein